MERGKILINADDIIGKRLDKLEVISYYRSQYVLTKGGERLRHYYLCKCNCGNVIAIQRGPLKNGIVYSCGCSRKKKP